MSGQVCDVAFPFFAGGVGTYCGRPVGHDGEHWPVALYGDDDQRVDPNA